jgi:hypothetical protein
MCAMSTPKTPPTAVTVDQILNRCEQECLDEFVPRTEKNSRRHFVHLRAQVGPQEAVMAELRTFAKRLDVRKGRIGRSRRLTLFSAAFTIAVRQWFSIKANVLREVDRE